MILVTGAAGFIGSNVRKQLIARGISVIGIDNLNNYHDFNLKNFRIGNPTERRPFEVIDIENQLDLDKLFEKYHITGIIHLAARAGVRNSIENPHVYFTTNVMGTVNLLECAKKHGIKKIVMASTSSLYAGQKSPFVEDMAVNEPLTPYAASKKGAEAACYSYHHLYGIDVSIVRYFTVYGPAGRPDMCIYRWVDNMMNDRPIHVTGDGTQSRDFTYVDDIALGTIKAYENCSGYEVFNLGGGKEPTNLLQTIDIIRDEMSQEPKIEFIPAQKADMDRTQADISKAKVFLDWEPRTGLHEGLKETIVWHRNNWFSRPYCMHGNLNK